MCMHYFNPAVEYCASDPCLNGGTCQNEDTNFACECAEGWIGETCSGKNHSLAANLHCNMNISNSNFD